MRMAKVGVAWTMSTLSECLLICSSFLDRPDCFDTPKFD
jgi:hypothetical protein